MSSESNSYTLSAIGFILFCGFFLLVSFGSNNSSSSDSEGMSFFLLIGLLVAMVILFWSIVFNYDKSEHANRIFRKTELDRLKNAKMQKESKNISRNFRNKQKIIIDMTEGDFPDINTYLEAKKRFIHNYTDYRLFLSELSLFPDENTYLDAITFGCHTMDEYLDALRVSHYKKYIQLVQRIGHIT